MRPALSKKRALDVIAVLFLLLSTGIGLRLVAQNQNIFERAYIPEGISSGGHLGDESGNVSKNDEEERERIRERRQPQPVATPVVPSTPATPVVPSPTSPSGSGYSLSQILNPSAEYGRAGYNYGNGQVAGFYLAPNGQYYAVSESAGGPSANDLLYMTNTQTQTSTGVTRAEEEFNRTVTYPLIERNYNIIADPNSTKDEADKALEALKYSLSIKEISQEYYDSVFVTAAKNLVLDTNSTQDELNKAWETLRNAVSAGKMSQAEYDKLIALRQSTTQSSGLARAEQIFYQTVTYPLDMQQLMMEDFMSKISSGEIDYQSIVNDPRNYSCPSPNSTIQQSYYNGDFFCYSNPDPDNLEVRCEVNGCHFCTKTFISTCKSVIPQIAIPLDLLAAATAYINSNTKPLWTACNSSSECGSGNCASSWVEPYAGQTARSSGDLCTYSTTDQQLFHDRIMARQGEQASALLTVAGGVGLVKVGAAGVDLFAQSWRLAGGNLLRLPGALVQTGLSTPTVLQGITLANLVDDASTIAACQATGDELTCAWANIALANPIPGAGLSIVDDIADVEHAFGTTVKAVENVVSLTDNAAELTNDAAAGLQILTNPVVDPNLPDLLDLTSIPDDLLTQQVLPGFPDTPGAGLLTNSAAQLTDDAAARFSRLTSPVIDPDLPNLLDLTDIPDDLLSQLPHLGPPIAGTANSLVSTIDDVPLQLMLPGMADNLDALTPGDRFNYLINNSQAYTTDMLLPSEGNLFTTSADGQLIVPSDTLNILPDSPAVNLQISTTDDLLNQLTKDPSTLPQSEVAIHTGGDVVTKSEDGTLIFTEVPAGDPDVLKQLTSNLNEPPLPPGKIGIQVPEVKPEVPGVPEQIVPTQTWTERITERFNNFLDSSLPLRKTNANTKLLIDSEGGKASLHQKIIDLAGGPESHPTIADSAIKLRLTVDTLVEQKFPSLSGSQKEAISGNIFDQLQLTDAYETLTKTQVSVTSGGSKTYAYHVVGQDAAATWTKADLTNTPEITSIALVADGHGVGGEIASQIARDDFLRYFEASPYKNDPQQSMRYAFDQLERKITSRLPHDGGTTLTVAVQIGDQLYIGHIGDSLLFHIDAETGAIMKLTTDHNWPGGARRYGILLSNALGDIDVKRVARGEFGSIPDILAPIKIKPGDKIIIGSDSLEKLSNILGGQRQLETTLVQATKGKSAVGGADAVANIARNNHVRDDIGISVLNIESLGGKPPGDLSKVPTVTTRKFSASLWLQDRITKITDGINNLPKAQEWYKVNVTTRFNNIFSSIRDRIVGSKILDSVFGRKPPTPEISGSTISQHLTGIPIKDTQALTNRLKADQLRILAETGLPSPELRRTNPELYIQRIREVAGKYGIPIRSFDEIPAQFRSQAPTGAFYDESWGTNALYVKSPNSLAPDELGSLAHEITHGIDYRLNADIPIEFKEYRAYMAEFNLSALDSETIEGQQSLLTFIFDKGVGSSTAQFLQQRGVTTMPWDVPKAPQTLWDRLKAIFSSPSEQGGALNLTRITGAVAERYPGFTAKAQDWYKVNVTTRFNDIFSPIRDRIVGSKIFDFTFGRIGSENLPEIPLQRTGDTFSFEYNGKQVSLTPDPKNSWVVVETEGAPRTAVKSGDDIVINGERVALVGPIGIDGTPILRQYPSGQLRKNVTVFVNRVTKNAIPIQPGEIFDPRAEVGKILNAPDRARALADFKTKLAYQQRGLAEIQTQLRRTITRNPDTPFDEITMQANEMAIKYGLTHSQRGKIFAALDLYSLRRMRVKELLAEYPNQNDLFEALFGRKPLGKIKITEGSANFRIQFYNAKDYDFVYSGDYLAPPEQLTSGGSKSTGGFFMPSETLLPDTQGLVVAINNTQVMNRIFPFYGRVLLIHEEQHALNNILDLAEIIYPINAPDLGDNFFNLKEIVAKGNLDEIAAASRELSIAAKQNGNVNLKNELLAFFMEGSPTFLLRRYLTQPESKGGLYDFYSNYRTFINSSFVGSDPTAQKVISDIFSLEMGSVAYGKVVDDSLRAFDLIISKGYTRAEAVALLEGVDLSSWLRTAERLPTPNIFRRAGSYLTGKILTPSNLAFVTAPSNLFVAGVLAIRVLVPYEYNLIDFFFPASDPIQADQTESEIDLDKPAVQPQPIPTGDQSTEEESSLPASTVLTQPLEVELITPPIGLTNKPWTTCILTGGTLCDGVRMFELYSWYREQPNGWWNQDGNFTPGDFLAMMLMGEANGSAPLLEAISIAATHQLWGTGPEHDAYCTTPDCAAGIFNFLGAYVQSASTRYLFLENALVNNYPGQLEGLTMVGDAESILNQGVTLEQIANQVVYNPDPANQTWGLDVPVHWGIPSSITGTSWVSIAHGANAKTGTTDPCGIYYSGHNDKDVVYTLRQVHNWESLHGNFCPRPPKKDEE